MSDTVRVYEIAEEAGVASTEVIAKAKVLGIVLKSPQTAVSYEDAENIVNYLRTGTGPKIVNKADINKKTNDNDLIKNIKSIGLIIKNLKQIKELEFDIKLEKGIYAILCSTCTRKNL